MNLILVSLIFLFNLSFSNSDGETSYSNELLKDIEHPKLQLESTKHPKVKVKKRPGVISDASIFSTSVNETDFQVKNQPGSLSDEPPQSKIKKRPGVLSDEPSSSKVKKRPGVVDELPQSKVKKRPGVLNDESSLPLVPSTNNTQVVTKNILRPDAQLNNFSESQLQYGNEDEIRNSSIVPRKGVEIEMDSSAESSIIPRKGVLDPSKIGELPNSSPNLTDKINLSLNEPQRNKSIVDVTTEMTPSQHVTDDKGNISDNQSVHSMKNPVEDSEEDLEEDSEEDLKKGLKEDSEEDLEEDSEENLSNEKEDLITDGSRNGTKVDADNESITQSFKTSTDTDSLLAATSTLSPPTSVDGIANNTNASIPTNVTTPHAPPALVTSLSKPTTASSDDNTSKSSSNTAIIIAILIVVLVCSLIGFISYKRLKAYWYRRHYSRVDYLIDGLYEM